VNWFRLDEHGKFLWPGYSENLRILEWILDRCNNRVEAAQTPVGYVPRPQDLDLTGLSISRDTLQKLLDIDRFEWIREMESQKDFLKMFGNKLPREIWSEWEAQNKRLQE
jgi:phosphoenolpyruvate carboxykinase (GTP)